MPVNNNKLVIISWNAQGISNTAKQTELQSLINSKTPDIVCLQETFLNQQNKMYIAGYNTYRLDRDTHGGGVAVIVRKGIKHRLTNGANTKCIENLSIEVMIRNSTIIITSAYYPPKYHTTFSEDIKKCLNQNKEFFIFGDLNAKHSAWNCVKNNRAGTDLNNLQQISPINIFHTPTPTHFPFSGHTPSTIDLLITNTSLNISEFYTTHELVSDHQAIICEIDMQAVFIPRQVLDFEKANWVKFQELIEQGLNNINAQESSAHIDLALDQFVNLL